jgi:hypothetical protein
MYWHQVLEVKMQLMGFHARPIIKMSDDNWYAMDGGLHKIPAADITGTAIVDRHMYVRNYLKTAAEVKIMDENKDFEARYDLQILVMGALLVGSDDYLGGAVSQRLRSVYDMKWYEEKPKEDLEPIEVDLIGSYQINTDEQGESTLTKAAEPEQNNEELEYVISKEDRLNTRITGQIDLSGKNIKDLEGLRGIEVSHIDLENTGITELSILENAPLEEININRTKVTKIDVLTNKPLRVVKLGYTGITDLSPLRGKPIEILDLSGWHIDEKTIEIIMTLPIRTLILRDTDISDISVFEGLNIEGIDLSNTKVKDFSSLEKWQELKIVQVDEHSGIEAKSESQYYITSKSEKFRSVNDNKRNCINAYFSDRLGKDWGEKYFRKSCGKRGTSESVN